MRAAGNSLAVRISLVIPAYNEESEIASCLEHVVAQTRPPDEVLVVDNNSTDLTCEIARSYVDKLPIRIVHERRQGVSWARRLGFDAATGEVFGRIDADTLIEPRWCESLERVFETSADVDAVTGGTWIRDIPWEGWFRQRIGLAVERGPTSRSATVLMGANMAISREAWLQAKGFLKDEPGTHEDIDLYYAVGKSGGRAVVVPALTASIAPRRVRVGPLSNRKYRRAAIRSVQVHGDVRRARKMTLQNPIFYIGLTVFWLFVRPFDAQARRWRPWYLLTGEDKRDDAIT